MLDFHAASDRAVRQAIQTGHMPNMYLIHALQRGEGYEPCFGRATERCARTHCRFHVSCMSLYEFDAIRSAPNINADNIALDGPRSVPLSVLGLPTMPTEECEKVIPLKPLKRESAKSTV